jgi:uncharacterized membrane protein YjfL (UPF0719 family)
MNATPTLELLSTIMYLILVFVSVIISVMGSVYILSFLTRRKIDVKKEIVKERNPGIALVLGSFIWTIGQMCISSMKPIMNVWYNYFASGFSLKTVLSFAAGTLGSLLSALVIGAITVYFSLKVLMMITKDIDEWEEIEQGNIAVAIVISITVVVVGMFFESIISYIVTNIFSL